MSVLTFHPAALLVPGVLKKIVPHNYDHTSLVSDRNQFYFYSAWTFISSMEAYITRDSNKSDFENYFINGVFFLSVVGTSLSLYQLRRGLRRGEYKICLGQVSNKGDTYPQVDLYPLFLLPGIVQAHAIGLKGDKRIPNEAIVTKVLKISEKRNQFYAANVMLVALAIFSALAFPTQTENLTIPAVVVALAINAYVLREFSRVAKNQFSYQLSYNINYSISR